MDDAKLVQNHQYYRKAIPIFGGGGGGFNITDITYEFCTITAVGQLN